MLSRVAENLYWIGRHVERAETAARLLDDAFHFELDAGGFVAGGHGPLQAVLAMLGCCPGADDKVQGDARNELLRFLTFDRRNDQSILTMIARARENARGVQETLSAEGWSQINRLYLALSGRKAQARFQASPFRFYESLKRGCILFAGLVDSTLPRTDAFHFLQAGRHLERADAVSRIAAVKIQALAEDEATDDLSLRSVHLTSLLRSCAAHEAYLKSYRDRLDPHLVVHYLVLDADFPRAIRFSIARCLESVHELAGNTADGYGSEAERLLGRLESELRYTPVEEIFSRGVGPFLHTIQDACNRTHNALGQAYFLV
jgi:uncharacterized alpha-E superfamily protein